MNVTVIEAKPEHFEKIYPLLRKLNDKTISKTEWNRLLTHPWSEGKPYGFVLHTEAGDIVGFLGTVYSRREVDGETVIFCNLTSWVVDEAYRQHSLKLAFAALKDREATITAFTATKAVSPIWAKLGLRTLEPAYRIALSVNPFTGVGSDWRASFGPEEARAMLTPSEGCLFDEHAAYGCQHLVVYSKRDPARYCYFIFTITRIKGMPLAHIHYVSDRSVFDEASAFSMWAIARQARTPAALVPERFLGKRGLAGVIRYRYVFRPDKIFYRSPRVGPELIDNLYSELILLNL